MVSDRLSGLSLTLKAVDSQLSESCEMEEIKLKALNSGSNTAREDFNWFDTPGSPLFSLSFL